MMKTPRLLLSLSAPTTGRRVSETITRLERYVEYRRRVRRNKLSLAACCISPHLH